VSVVMKLHRRASFWCSMFVPPRSECHKHAGEFFSSTRENVFDVGCVVAPRLAFDDAMFDEFAQSISQQVPADSKVLHEFVEPSYTDRKVTNDERRPPITNRFERSCERTVEVFKACLTHGASVAKQTPSCTIELHASLDP
jgi:hypothetical protein